MLEKRGGLKAHEEEIWGRVAYAARYGNQSLETILRLPQTDIVNFNNALEQLLAAENKVPK